MAIAAMFDEEVKEDLDRIKWNPFCADEQTVLKSKKVSFYKGMPVYRFNNSRSGTFYAIFLSKSADGSDPEDITTLKHERGHGWQSMMMGIVNYLITVCIPSPLCLGPWDSLDSNNRYRYYDAPWEMLPEILGGAINTTDPTNDHYHVKEDYSRAWWYYAVSFLCPLAAFFFLLTD